MSQMYFGEQDPFVLEDERGYATGMIMIPSGEDVEVFQDEYDADTNIHSLIFKFWDGEMVQHCLYEIDYNTNLLKSFIKDYEFNWCTDSIQKLSFYT